MRQMRRWRWHRDRIVHGKWLPRHLGDDGLENVKLTFKVIVFGTGDEFLDGFYDVPLALVLFTTSSTWTAGILTITFDLTTLAFCAR